VNAARITQAIPIIGEPVGIGTGEPDQALALSHAPVLQESITLVIEADNGTGEIWRKTDDLFAAGPNDKVYSLDPATGVIRFGSGLRGQRPAAARRLFASYEYGGGIEGNVAIGAIKASPDVRIGGFKIENPLATWGGDTGETVEEAERNLPAVVRHRERLVTAQDFKDVTLRTPGVDVGRADVLPLFKQGTTEDAAGVVTVMVIPRYDAARPRWPAPDRLFLQTVCAYLDERRLITTEIHVRGPDYVDVYITLGIKTRAGFFRDVVRQDVRSRLYEYLSSLPFGGPDGEGWPLRKGLDVRDLEAVATRVPGVEIVESMHMGVGSSEAVDAHTLTGLELPLLRNISVVEGEAEPLSDLVGGGAPVTAVHAVPVPVKRAVC
jgi:predicted phage baseplate assembly protein